MHLPHRGTPSAPPAPSSRSQSSSKQQIVNERFSKNQKINAKSSRNGSQSGQPSSKPSSSRNHNKSSKSHSQGVNQSTNHNHKSQKLSNVFTLKKRHKSNDQASRQPIKSKSVHQNGSKGKNLSITNLKRKKIEIDFLVI